MREYWQWALALAVMVPLLGADQPGDTKKADVYPYAINQWHTTEPGENANYNHRKRLIGRGLAVYQNHCAGCHGVKGDGLGPASDRLQVKPRDFTKGVFKFRSTRQLQLPMEIDLYRVISKGLPGVSMPGFPLMVETDKLAVIQYMKTLVPNWDEQAKQRQVVYVPQAPQDMKSTERIMRGRVVYLGMQCGRCHGMDGAGTGASIGVVEDEALGSILPRNFTRGRFRGGDSSEDIYRTFHTGLGGAMPQFDDNVILYTNQQTVAAQADYMEQGEQAKLAPYLAQFPKNSAEIFKLDDAAKRALIVRHSWDLVAYVKSLTLHPKATAPFVAAPADDNGQSGEDDEY